MNDLKELILEYQSYVEKIVLLMKKTYGSTNLLISWKRGEIPQNGQIGGLEFEFHGVGCCVSINDIEVDFDFGPDGRYDGFDVWRLSLFINNNQMIFNKYKNILKNLDNKMKELVDAKLIFHPQWFPGSSLYYFTEN